MHDGLREHQEDASGRTHKGEPEEPGRAEGFESHRGIVGAEVLSDQGGGGGADGKAGHEGKRFDPDGHDMCGQGTIVGESSDESDNVRVDEPHPEHFKSIGQSDPANAEDHLTLRNPADLAQGQSDFIGFRLVLLEEKSNHNDRSENPGEKAAQGQPGDAHAADRGIEKDETSTQRDVGEVDHQHDEKRRSGIAHRTKGIGAGIKNTKNRTGPDKDRKVIKSCNCRIRR